jgi:hypothetical protein
MLFGVVPVNGSGGLCSKVTVDEGKVQRADMVLAMDACEAMTTGLDPLDIVVSH